MKEVHLCGVLHIDLKGPERTRRLIERVRPDTITIEPDSEAAAIAYWIHKNMSGLADSPGIRKAYAFYLATNSFSGEQLKSTNLDSLERFYQAIGFENWVAREYKIRNQGVRIKLLDQGMPMEEEEIIMRFREEMKDYLHLAPEEFQRKVDSEYSNNSCKDDTAELTKVRERNQLHAEKILAAKGRVLHLGGLVHVFGNAPNLYELLNSEDVSLERYKLRDV